MKRGSLLLALAVSLPAAAQLVVNVQVGPPPPPEYVATTAPVYFEGHPCYYYDGYWRYRDPRGGWRYYREEPRVLYERRFREPPRHIYYENRRYAPAYDRRDWYRDHDRRDWYHDRRDWDRDHDRRDGDRRDDDRDRRDHDHDRDGRH